MPSCDGAESVSCSGGEDSCASNIVSYTVEMGDLSTDVSQVTSMCYSTAADVSSLCDTAESMLGSGEMFKDVKCKTDTCTTDGCNKKGASTTSSATGLFISFLLFAFTATLDMFN